MSAKSLFIIFTPQGSKQYAFCHAFLITMIVKSNFCGFPDNLTDSPLTSFFETFFYRLVYVEIPGDQQYLKYSEYSLKYLATTTMPRSDY